MPGTNGNTVKILLAIITMLATVNLAVIGALWGMQNARMDRFETKLNQVEKNISQIQAEYYRITLIDFRLGRIEKKLEQLGLEE